MISMPGFNKFLTEEKNMKTIKLVYPLACALAFTLATTGCHNHQVGKVTSLPGDGAGVVGGDNAAGVAVPPANTMNPDGGVSSGSGPIPVADSGSFDGMTEDTNALAAYTIHFAFDSAAIKSSEQADLQSVASALGANAGAKLLIEGNCDERGTEEYNRSLGERRALAAREALAKLNVDPSRVRTISYGKDKPADPGHDDDAWAKNRRDDFVLLLPKAGA
jgi:peptidoglycan-associated lipoprotein